MPNYISELNLPVLNTSTGQLEHQSFTIKDPNASGGGGGGEGGERIYTLFNTNQGTVMNQAAFMRDNLILTDETGELHIFNKCIFNYSLDISKNYMFYNNTLMNNGIDGSAFPNFNANIIVVNNVTGDSYPYPLIFSNLLKFNRPISIDYFINTANINETLPIVNNCYMFNSPIYINQNVIGDNIATHGFSSYTMNNVFNFNSLICYNAKTNLYGNNKCALGNIGGLKLNGVGSSLNTEDNIQIYIRRKYYANSVYWVNNTSSSDFSLDSSSIEGICSAPSVVCIDDDVELYGDAHNNRVNFPLYHGYIMGFYVYPNGSYPQGYGFNNNTRTYDFNFSYNINFYAYYGMNGATNYRIYKNNEHNIVISPGGITTSNKVANENLLSTLNFKYYLNVNAYTFVPGKSNSFDEFSSLYINRSVISNYTRFSDDSLISYNVNSDMRRVYISSVVSFGNGTIAPLNNDTKNNWAFPLNFNVNWSPSFTDKSLQAMLEIRNIISVNPAGNRFYGGLGSITINVIANNSYSYTQNKVITLEDLIHYDGGTVGTSSVLNQKPTIKLIGNISENTNLVIRDVVNYGGAYAWCNGNIYIGFDYTGENVGVNLRSLYGYYVNGFWSDFVKGKKNIYFSRNFENLLLAKGNFFSSGREDGKPTSVWFKSLGNIPNMYDQGSIAISSMDDGNGYYNTEYNLYIYNNYIPD